MYACVANQSRRRSDCCGTVGEVQRDRASDPQRSKLNGGSWQPQVTWCSSSRLHSSIPAVFLASNDQLDIFVPLYALRIGFVEASIS